MDNNRPPAPRSALVIQSSGRKTGSTTRSVTADLLTRLNAALPQLSVTQRDLNDGIAFVDDAWIDANATPPEDRTGQQAAALSFSDTLVEELEHHDLIIIAAPIYNFGVPASLKAWIDQVARARRTFQYTANGPVGLLKDKRAIIVTASGGTPVDSPIDFATAYLRHVLGFIGITNVSLVAADAQMIDADAARARAEDDINRAIDMLTGTPAA